MLLGSEIGAALTALEPLEIDLIGLNCATGPAEMSEHLRYLSRHARIGLSCMPNAGLPELAADGARYPLTPEQLADAHDQFTREFGLALVGGCCGTTPDHIRAVVERVGGRAVTPRKPRPEHGASSLYQHVPFRQDLSHLAVGERTNTNGSKAFREAMLEGRWDDCVEIAREQVRDGSHVLDLCVDYVGRDGAVDMREAASRLVTASTLPLTELPFTQKIFWTVMGHGMMSGHRVLTIPTLRNSTNCGINVTMYGNMMVLSTTTNRASRPGKRNRAKA